MKAMVIFDTRYGNTEKIAKSFEAGLHQAGIETLCVNARDVTLDGSLNRCDLICIGAPTEWHRASRPMRGLLRKLKGIDFSGKYGFAFDTKLSRTLSGSAAKSIENELRHLGLRIVAPRESATVLLVSGKVGGAYLKEGEEERFEQIGAQVGTALAARTGTTWA